MDPELLAAESSLLLSEDTEISLLAAGDPVFGDLVADDYKAYIRFRICTAFPNVIGPEMHGRYFGFHPQVLVNSYKSLLNQQTNLGHMLKAYGAYRDRIQGSIVGVSIGNLKRPLSGATLAIPETVEEAPFLDCIAVIWKLAEGNKELLGNHLSARRKTSVSIEVGSTIGDLEIYNPSDKSITSLVSAMEQWPNLLKKVPKRGIQIGKVDGVQFAFAAGGADGSIPFKGVGWVPDAAEGETARVTDLKAALGADDEVCFAALRQGDWLAGDEATWTPLYAGPSARQDAGRGIVREVIISGSHTRHGMTKTATAADPLLDIKVHGKNLTVLRHASSLLKKI